jgi:3-oxoacyl-[acyl-carrier protein] reductase
MRLQGKVALITGSSRGIGRSIAQLFAKEGAKAVINYNKSKKEALSLAKELQKQDNEVLLIKANVSRSDEVKNMVKKTIDEFGQLDILVNNAGILISTTLFRLDRRDVG